MKKLKFNKKGLIATFAISLTIIFAGLVMAATAPTLGVADSFAVLAGASIVDSNPSVITGDVGLSPGTAFGALTSAEVSGTIYAVDASGPDGAGGNNPVLVGNAKTALTTAYNNAAGQTPTIPVIDHVTDSFSGFPGYVLAPGIYNSAAKISITGTLTLNGSATDVWVFQAGSTLTTASGADIVLTGGAQACNVFWQVGTSATLGTSTLFKGTIMADQSITDNGGSIVQGRLLARIASVTLNNTTVVKPTCVEPLILSLPRATAPAAVAPVFTAPPLINVTKIPSPLTLVSGPGLVTYAYAVTNIGTVPMHNVTISDNKCNTISFISGDVNSNSLLEVDEVWNYRCTKIVSETETNTVTVHGLGSDNWWDAYDIASATVVVKAALVPPLIHVVKKPNVSVLPAGGGAVIYSYSVTNPGTAPLNNVSIVDDKCTGLPGRVVGHPGDLNKNNLLESNEVWQFTCQTNLTKTTTNIATAQGHANGLTAIDFAQATVVVSAPGLPKTGFGPEGKNLLNILVPTGIIALLSSLYIARKKRIV